MRRFITSFAFALCCSALVTNAQETTTKTQTKTSGNSPQVITYTGCVQTGTQAKTYVLDKVVPVTKTTTKTEREDWEDSKTRSRTETKNAMPEFRVTSIKTIGQC